MRNVTSLLLSKDSDFFTRQPSVVGGTLHSDSDQNKEVEEIMMTSGIQHVVEVADLQPLPAEEVELRTIVKEWNSSHGNKGKEEIF